MRAPPSHRHFHDELADLKAKLLTLSGEAEAALSASVQALLERDAAKAAKVIAGDGTLNDLENEGDHAANIAQSVERLSASRPITPEPELVEMARQAGTMLADAMEAFVRGDAAAGRAICRRDDQVDALHRSMFRILLTHMAEDPHMIGVAIELLLVSRNLERVADLATNIAEDVVFLVEGKNIKHHVEDRAPGGAKS